jgi:hypothetical protein
VTCIIWANFKILKIQGVTSSTWCTPHLGVSCIDQNSSRIGALTHNCNRGNSSSNSSSSSSVLLFHYHSRMPPGLHNNFQPATYNASTTGRWATLLENAASPSKATHHELWHSWSTSKGAISADLLSETSSAKARTEGGGQH